jgi:uncharacterized OsmC-like protein
MSPPEFLLVSLGTCAGYYATQYLKTRGLDPGRVTVRVSAQKALQPARLNSFIVEVDAPDVATKYHEGLLRSVKACLIHNTLSHGAAVDVHLNTLAIA